MGLPWLSGSYSPTKAHIDKFATEAETKLRLKKKTNRKWILYLTLISSTSVSLVLLIMFFALNVESLKRHQRNEGNVFYLFRLKCWFLIRVSLSTDECGLVYDQENLRIINGIEAKPHSWPAQVVVIFSYYVGNYSLWHPNSTEDMIFIGKPFGALCGGTLINRWTVMTAAHCIIKSVEYKRGNESYNIDVEPNEFYPTYESMFNVILGDHYISDSMSKVKSHRVQNHGIQKIVRVNISP